MVTKTDICSFTEGKIYPGKGRRHIAKDGRLYFFIGQKARMLFHQKIKPVKLTWTTAWRRFNKKIRIDEAAKKRTRKTTRVQKAVVGMSLDDIKRKKAETRGERDKKLESAAVEIKARQVKAMQAKKVEKAKIAKVVQPKAVAPKNVKANIPKGVKK